MSHICSQCDRALKTCEWCGSSSTLTADGQIFPVTTKEDWDGYFHEPCPDAERQALRTYRGGE